MVEKKLIAATVAELAFAKEVADFRRGAVYIVRVDLNNDRHFVRRVAFEKHMLHLEFVSTAATAFLYSALNDVAGHALLACLVDGRRQARITLWVRPAH